MRIVRLARAEFETDTGDVFPIEPPLEEDMTVEEFQEHFDFASQVISRCSDVGRNDPDIEELDKRR